MNCSVLAAAMRFEWRILRREVATWAVLVSIAAIVGFALCNGAARVSAQSKAIEQARVEEGQRLAFLRKSLVEIEAGRGGEDLPPYRDPRNAAFAGGGAAAAVAALSLQPLGLLATGQSDLYPPAIKVTTGSKDSFLFADEIENPAHLMTGSIDLAFVLVFVFPLWILALTYNLVSAEREQGTLALTLASARDPHPVLAGKLLLRAGLPIVATCVAIAIGVGWFAGPKSLLSTEFFALLAAVLAYGAFWTFLAATVDARAGGSARSALILMGAWVTLTMIAPAAVNSVANYLHPSPSRIEMVLAARAAATDADRERDAMLARYADEHGEGAGPKRGSAEERSLRRLAAQEAANARVEALIAEHESQLAEQRRLTERLSFLSPALSTYRAVADAAGAGDRRYAGFMTALDGFHRVWRAFFSARARAGKSLALEDYGALPRFSPPEEVSPAPDILLVAGAGVGLPALLLAAFAWRGVRCYRVG